MQYGLVPCVHTCKCCSCSIDFCHFVGIPCSTVAILKDCEPAADTSCLLRLHLFPLSLCIYSAHIRMPCACHVCPYVHAKWGQLMSPPTINIMDENRS